MHAREQRGETHFSACLGAGVCESKPHVDDGVVKPGVKRRTRSEGLASSTGGRTADRQVGVRERGVGQAEAELEAGLDVVLRDESALTHLSRTLRGKKRVTYSIEVAVVDEDALRIWDLHDVGTGVGDTRGVVGLVLRDGERQLAAGTCLVGKCE